MDDITKRRIEIHQAAINEYSIKRKVENTRCERCNELIVIEQIGGSAYSVKCKCGYHNDTLRGL